ncbi:ATP-binding cassette domain-containing protein [Streptomyces sp. NPDC055722]
MTAAISVAGLERRYRDHQALTDVTFEIGTPCIAGLLSRNGAGKTTLLRILAGQEFATSGRVHVFGAGPLENDAVLRRMFQMSASSRRHSPISSAVAPRSATVP